MFGRWTDITYIKLYLENITREIDESIRLLGLQENVSSNTQYTCRPDRALSNSSQLSTQSIKSSFKRLGKFVRSFTSSLYKKKSLHSPDFILMSPNLVLLLSTLFCKNLTFLFFMQYIPHKHV